MKRREKMKTLKEWIEKEEIGVISEATFKRVISTIESGVDFAMISVSRQTNSKKVNEQNNTKLLQELRKKIGYKLGAYRLVGHWKECSKTLHLDAYATFDDMKNKCSEGGGYIFDALENSWLIVIKDGEWDKTFETLLELSLKYHQDAFIARHNEKTILYGSKGQELMTFKNLNNPDDFVLNGFMKILGKQGYTEFINFEIFAMKPKDTNYSKMAFKAMNILYEDDKK
jgi:hypothetical protein